MQPPNYQYPYPPGQQNPQSCQPQYQPPAISYSQPPYQPQYQPPAPPARGVSAGVIVALVVVVVVAVLAPVLYFTTFAPKSGGGPAGGGNVETALGLSVATTPDGDWIISVSGGSSNAADVTMKLLDYNTGATALSVKVNAIADSDGVFNDNNRNDKIDAGDTILLKATGSAEPGLKVQFLKGSNIIGTIKELPDGGTVVTSLGLTVTRTSSGDWRIDVTTGSANAADVTLKLINPNTGATDLSVKLNAIASSDGEFNDNNQNGKIEVGDNILLKSTGTAEAGMKLQFQKGDNVIGSIRELPN